MKSFLSLNMHKNFWPLQKIKRSSLSKYSAQEIDVLVQAAVAHIKAYVQPVSIFLVGSALIGQFDDWSDLDFVLVFSTKEEARLARKTLYRQKRADERPIDYVCVDSETYERKSKIGGILFVAAEEGRLLL